MQYEEVESSNWLFGIVGALIGSLIGVALWIGIYQTGYISSLGGIVIVLGIIAGYTILGKRFDVKGVVICILLSAIMLFVAQYTAVSVSIYREFQKYGMDVPFKDVFKNLFSLLKGTDSMGGFYEDLAWGYVIVVISWVVLWKEKISKGN